MNTRLAAGILALGLAAGAAWGQNPDLIQSTHDTMKALQKKQQIDSDAALGNTAKASSQPTHAPVATGDGAKAENGRPFSRKAAKQAAHSAKVVASRRSAKHKTSIAVASEKPAASTQPARKVLNFAGARDPFVSPVVNQAATGSGCSVGKRCLAIDQIALKGVVSSDNGMIAVVVNSLDKAYFLRENDPVFNGYVLKITGDSIVFKETVQDRLGKHFTREITKKIFTPAV